MQAYEVRSFGQPLSPVERPALVPEGTEVLLRVKRCGVCHSDVHLRHGSYDLGGGHRLTLADRGIFLPIIMGHEVLGAVLAFGGSAGLDETALGRAFLVYPWMGCGGCLVCSRGDEHLCADVRPLGVFRSGGYAEEVLVPHPRYLIPVEGLEPAVAATYACSGLTAYGALKKVKIDPEREALLLIGAGGLGQNALLIAKALGYHRIIVAEPDAARRQTAVELGAGFAFDPNVSSPVDAPANLGPVGAVIDFVGSEATSSMGMAALRKGGLYVAVGLFGGELRLPLPVVAMREIGVQGSYVGSIDDLKELVAMAQAGRVGALQVELIPMQHASEALDRLESGRFNGRFVLSTEMGEAAYADEKYG